MHSNTTLSIDVTNYMQRNTEFAIALLPNTVLFLIILVFGTLANGLILYIYVFAMKKRQDRFFIPWLAISDISTCLFGSCFGIYLNFNRLDSQSDFFCRSAWIVNSGSVFFGAYLLLVIAIQRYRKICHPFGLQMTRKWGKVSLAVAFIISALMAFPAGLFNGVSKLPAYRFKTFDQKYGFYFVCETLPTEEIPDGFEAYNIILGSVALIGITSVTVLYVFIGMKMFAQLKFRKQNLKKKKKISVTSESNTNIENCNGDRKYSLESCDKSIDQEVTNSDEKDHNKETDANGCESRETLVNCGWIEKTDFDIFTGKELETINAHSCNKAISNGDTEMVVNDADVPNGLRIGSDSSCESMDALSTKSGVDLLDVHPIDKHHPKKPLRTVYKTFKKTKSFLSTHRYSIIFILITVCFLLSFLPRIYLMTMETIVTDFWFNLTLSEYRSNLFLHQMYLLHSFCNPFIYVILDEKFKDTMKKKCICCLAKFKKDPVIVVN